MQPRLAQYGVALHLFRLSPGSERTFAEALFDVCRDQQDRRMLFKIFGYPDLALLELNYDEANPMRLPSSEAIRDQRLLVGCPWIENENSRLQCLQSLPMIGITAFKLPMDAVARLGVGAETAVVSGIYRLSREYPVEIMPMASAGWSEILLLTFAPDPKTLVSFVLGAAGAGVPPQPRTARGSLGESQPAEETVPLVDSSTLVGVRLGENAGTVSTAVQGVQIRLRIACPPSNIPSLFPHLELNFGDVRAVLGHFDVMVDVSKIQDLQTYVTRLWEFRTAFGAQIHRTETVFTLEQQIPTSRPSSSGLAQSPTSHLSAADAIEKVPEPTLASMLRHLDARLREHLADSRTSSAYVDIVPCFSDLLCQLNHLNWEDDKQLSLLGDTLEVLLWAFEERARGTTPTLGEYFEMPDAPLYGIHRSLLAARFLCRSILGQAVPDFHWKGFVTFGYSSDYRQYSGSLFNIPLAYALDPARFWGVTHEVSHEIGRQLHLLDDKEIRYQLMRQGLEGDQYLEIVWEVFAEIGCWMFGFGKDRWAFYVESVWKYLEGQERVHGHMQPYLVRFLVTIAYRNFLEGGATLTPNAQSLQKAAQSLIEQIQPYAPRCAAKLDADAVLLAVEKASKLAAALPRIHDSYWKPLLDSHKYPSEQDAYQAGIRTGLVPREIRNPSDLVVRLLNDPNTSLRERMGTLLALWHSEVLLLGSAREDVDPPRIPNE